MISETRNPPTSAIDQRLSRLASELDAIASSNGVYTEDEQFTLVNTTIRHFFNSLRHAEINGVRFSRFEFLSPAKEVELTKLLVNDITNGYSTVKAAQENIESRANRFFSFFRDVNKNALRFDPRNIITGINVIDNNGVKRVNRDRARPGGRDLGVFRWTG